jgi:L-lactate dehydrogenase complex protein LldG
MPPAERSPAARRAALRERSVTLLEQFEEAARAVGATVERVLPAPEQIAAAVVRATPQEKRIAVAESRDLDRSLLDACRRLPGAFAGRTKRELAGADVGVTEAFAGVARTGSLCVDTAGGYTGYVSLLARIHVAVLAAETIVERPSDLFLHPGSARAGLSRDFVFITGPSATADMGTLVRGVHGPHRLHILIVE